MEYRVFKKDDRKVSLLGFGAMRLPVADEKTQEVDYAVAKQMIDAAYNAGVNYFDTAYCYHEGYSETFLGEALSEYPRESYFLTNKMPVWMLKSADDIPRIFDEQLQRCKTDYFDFYLMHSLGEKSFNTAEEYGLWEFLQKKKAEGKIRHIGFSFHDLPEVLEKICAKYPWEVGQIQMNYMDWEHQRANEQYEILEKYGIPCIVMEPMRGGTLTSLGDVANGILRSVNKEASIPSWAMRWVGAFPNVLCVLSGMHTPLAVEDNLKTYASLQPLSTEEQETLQEAIDEFRSHTLIGCTACRYCMPCPAGVDIPGLLAMRNVYAFSNDLVWFAKEYFGFPQEKNAAQCVSCGQCEHACPQSLPIINLLSQIHKEAEDNK